MNGLDRHRLPLRFECVDECPGDHPRHRVTGRAGDDQPRPARFQEECAIDGAGVDGSPSRAFRFVRRETECPWGVRAEACRDLLNRGRRADQPDLDIMRLRVLDGRSDEPEQRHQNQQPASDRTEDRLCHCGHLQEFLACRILHPLNS